MAVFFDGIKEIVLSVGTDIIKESSEEYCDTKKIRKELGEYIERERASFENIDMKLEIDFYSLSVYGGGE